MCKLTKERLVQIYNSQGDISPHLSSYEAKELVRLVLLYDLSTDFTLITDEYMLVPKKITAEQIRAIQLKTEIGEYISSNWSGAYDLFREIWDVALDNFNLDNYIK